MRNLSGPGLPSPAVVAAKPPTAYGHFGSGSRGLSGAFFRVHHFAPQAAAPMPLLSAIASRTKAIEVGTGVIDMR